MLAITGTGRSGTSLMAWFCREMGYDPGGQWQSRINAGMEKGVFTTMNRAIWQNGGANARQRKRILNYGRPTFKDPRLMIYPEALQEWIALRPDLGLLILFRPMAHVAASAERHPKWFKRRAETRNVNDMRDDDHMNWRYRQFYECLCTAVASKVPMRLLTFPEFLEDYDAVHEALTTVGGLEIPYEEGKQCWDRLVDLDKVHIK